MAVLAAAVLWCVYPSCVRAQAEPSAPEPVAPAATPAPEPAPEDAPSAEPTGPGSVEPEPAQAVPADTPEPTDAQKAADAPESEAGSNATSPVVDRAAEVKPRLELYVPSAHRLISEVQRSRMGLFTGYLRHLLRVLSSDSAGGIQADDIAAVAEVVKQWPDTPIEGAVFAHDRDGRLQWAFRVGVSSDDLAGHLRALLETEAVERVFAGLSLAAKKSGGYALSLAGEPLLHIVPCEGAKALIASRDDVAFPGELSVQAAASEEGVAALLACRLNLTQTERDSGATAFSSFSFVTGVDYLCHVNDTGDWIDSVRVTYPPVAGMATKALLGRVKDTFFVPAEAFGAVAFNAIAAQTLLEQFAGLGAQAIQDGSGPMVVVGAPQAGPLSRHVDESLCVTMLPGTGFLPAPDLVVQCRAKRTGTFHDDIRKAVEKINQLHRDLEQPEPWREETVRDRTVFLRDTGSQSRGMMMPLVMRQVIFLNKEKDAGGTERELIIIGWTSTTPKRLVERWLDLPRFENRQDLPNARKTEGQMWVNWRQVYRWAQPYVNLSIAVVSPDALLPTFKEAEPVLSDARVTLKVRYEGLTASHQGPAPLGMLAIPLMFEIASAEDRSGAGDLARERLAAERLEVLFHHSKLFHKDVGRWPAEVAELDGYIDFANNPRLLRLNLSPRKRWSERLEGLFGGAQREKSDELDEIYGKIDDRLFRIDWGREDWRLGLAPGTLEHLDALYIDQDGVIHRVEKANPAQEVAAPRVLSEEAESAAP